MRRILSAIDARDIVTGLGLVLMTAGLALVSVPAALFVPGLLLFVVAVVPAVFVRGGGK